MPRRGRRTALALATLALAMLASALGFQAFGLRPCELCWWQRYAWMAALSLALAAALGPRRTRPALLALAALATLAGAGIAGFHVGVEQHWWAGTAACGSDGPAATPEELLRRLLARQPARCDEVAWSLFGISMAGWNGLIALASGVPALAVAVRAMRRSKT